MKVAVKTMENKSSGDVTLNKDIFGLEPKKDVLYRAVNWQLAKRRSGNHKVKDVSEISGTGKKPFAQKGTGNARQGSLRSAQMRGGQTTHGPQVRDHGFSLPKKMRKLALKMALSAKQKDGKLIVLDAAKVKSAKTKDMAASLKKMELTSALFIDGDSLDENFVRSIRNIPNMDVLPSNGANVYDILRRDTLVLTKEAIEKLEARLS